MKTSSWPGWVSCSKAFVLFLFLLSLATALACSRGLPKDIPTNKEAVKKALKDKAVEKLKEVAEDVPAVQKAMGRVVQAQLGGCAKVFQTALQAVANVAKEGAPVIIADSVYTAAEPNMIKGKRVVVVGDGPTLTHGGMPYGTGSIAAQNLGAAEIVPGIGFAVGSIKDSYQAYPHMNAEVPALGYSADQLADLEATLNAADADLVVYATPVDLSRLVNVNKPMVAVEYEFREAGPRLREILTEFQQEYLVRS